MGVALFEKLYGQKTEGKQQFPSKTGAPQCDIGSHNVANGSSYAGGARPGPRPCL